MRTLLSLEDGKVVLLRKEGQYDPPGQNLL